MREKVRIYITNASPPLRQDEEGAQPTHGCNLHMFGNTKKPNESDIFPILQCPTQSRKWRVDQFCALIQCGYEYEKTDLVFKKKKHIKNLHCR